MSQLDLLLVNPGARKQLYGGLGSELAGIEPPLWAALIAAFVRQHGHSVKIFDAEAEGLDAEATVDEIISLNATLVAIVVLGSNPSASSTPKMTIAGKLAKLLKQKNPSMKLIFTGLHPSALPERTLKEEATDFVCQGEGFYTVLNLIECIKSGKDPVVAKVPGLWTLKDGEVLASSSPPLMDPDVLPMAAWDLLPMDKYKAHNWHCFDNLRQRKPYAVVYTSLGCPFNCAYCNIHAQYNGKPGIRMRSPEKVVEEISFLVNKYGVRNIKFVDELFALDEERVNRICDLIKRQGFDLNIWAYARVDTVKQNTLIKMKQAGINWVAFGFESASTQVRHGVAKRFTQETIVKAVEMARNAGLYVNGNFIFGLPDDNLTTMEQNLDLAKNLNLEYVNFYVAMAYPGSRLYNDAIEQHIKLPQSWHGYGQYSAETLPMPTKYLTAAEVLRFRDKAFNDYFSSPAYLEMIRSKFGREALEHIQEMLKITLDRNHV